MDEASADLILALQVQDLAELVDRAADHDDEGAEGDTSSDAHIAWDSYREELRKHAAIISDLHVGEMVGEAAGDEPPSPFASSTPTFDQTLVKSFGLHNLPSKQAPRRKTKHLLSIIGAQAAMIA